ncbi:hypothetical protein ACVDG5_015475 [Mesorhizobium sp. ORM6]
MLGPINRLAAIIQILIQVRNPAAISPEWHPAGAADDGADALAVLQPHPPFGKCCNGGGAAEVGGEAHLEP